jgi:hypothetical protein
MRKTEKSCTKLQNSENMSKVYFCFDLCQIEQSLGFRGTKGDPAVNGRKRKLQVLVAASAASLRSCAAIIAARISSSKSSILAAVEDTRAVAGTVVVLERPLRELCGQINFGLSSFRKESFMKRREKPGREDASLQAEGCLIYEKPGEACMIFCRHLRLCRRPSTCCQSMG